MKQNIIAAFAAVFTVALMAPLLGFIVIAETGEETAPALALEVSDKQAPIAAAEEVAEIGEAVEPEPEYEEYYEPVYYNSYWYTSDDAEAEADAKEWIAFRESGGDYGATNGRYIGRYQLDSSYLDGDYSEENQEAAAEAYIADRYGSWQAAQEHHQQYGWY